MDWLGFLASTVGAFSGVWASGAAIGASMSHGSRAVVAVVLLLLAVVGAVVGAVASAVSGLWGFVGGVALGLSFGVAWGLIAWAVSSTWKAYGGDAFEWRGVPGKLRGPLGGRVAQSVAGVAVAACVVWYLSENGAEKAAAVRPVQAVRAVQEVEPLPVAAVPGRKADIAESCECADGGRCTGPKGGVFCRKPDGTKKYY